MIDQGVQNPDHKGVTRPGVIELVDDKRRIWRLRSTVSLDSNSRDNVIQMLTRQDQQWWLARCAECGCNVLPKLIYNPNVQVLGLFVGSDLVNHWKKWQLELPVRKVPSA